MMRARARRSRPASVTPACRASPARAAAPSNQWLQAKLLIGAVDDPLEREADRVAETLVGGATAGPVAAEGQTVRRKAIGPDQRATAPAALGLGRGTALSAAERAFFEPRLGLDLSAVRLHRHVPLAAELGARAFTLGRDVAFAPAEWRPGTPEGRRLLAHELVHVVQQAQAGGPRVQRQANPIDKQAQALIDLAHDAKKSLKWRALELVGRMLQTYFPKRAGLVAGVSYDESEPGLRTTYRGKVASRVGLITVGRNFVEGTTRRMISRRVAQLDHELTHVEQQRAGMEGANRSDEREFLAFAEEAAFKEPPGTGTMPHAMRVTLIDAALGYYHCLSAALQKQHASREKALLTLRALHDGKAGNSSTKPPTACRRQG